MCSGSEEGSHLRLLDFVYHSTLGLRVITKKKDTCPREDASVRDRLLDAIHEELRLLYLRRIDFLFKAHRLLDTCPREDGSVGDRLLGAIHEELRLRGRSHVQGQHLRVEGVWSSYTGLRVEGVWCRVWALKHSPRLRFRVEG